MYGLGSNLSDIDFINFVTRATEERERVKFEFTKNLSKALDYIAQFVQELGISREDASFIHFSDIKALKTNSLSEDELVVCIKNRKQRYDVTKIIELPAVIGRVDDLFCFESRLCSRIL